MPDFTPIEMNKPAQDFFEGGVLGNGGMGVIVCTRPDAVVLYFGHNNVWDIRVAENNRDKLLTFDEVWERLSTSSTQDGPGERSPGFSPDGLTEITVDLALYPDGWFKDYCAMAGEDSTRNSRARGHADRCFSVSTVARRRCSGIASRSTAGSAKSPS